MSELALKLIRENIEKHERGEDASYLDLGYCGLENLPNELFECIWLKKLSLSNELRFWKSSNKGHPNEIYRLSDSINNLHGLEYLSVGNDNWHNRFPLFDISPLSKLTQLKTLDITGTYVWDLSPLFDLPNLTGLNIRRTNVTDSSQIKRIVGLRRLNISKTKISGLSHIACLKDLESLDFGETRIYNLSPLTKLPLLNNIQCYSSSVASLSPLSNLHSLRGVYFGGTQVSDLTPLSKLENLIAVNCSGTLVSDLSSLSELINFSWLACHNTPVEHLNDLTNLKKITYLGIAATKVLNLKPIQDINSLKHIDISKTGISDLECIKNHVNLEKIIASESKINDLSSVNGLDNLSHLEVSKTDIVSLNPLQGLANLQYLDVSRSRISDLTPLKNLPGLQYLNVSQTEVSDLSSILHLAKSGIEFIYGYKSLIKGDKEGVIIYRCPLVHPPIEIARQGNEAILRYFNERERGQTIKVREAKLLIVGQGKAGKTSLRRKLEDPAAPMPAIGDTTRGIEITRLDALMPGTGTPFRINIWDFGGQNVQHYAHQFFLTGSSLYALVTNERIQDHVHLPYWLNIIEMLGKKSPVILIQNQDGGYCSSLPKEAAIRERFQNVHNRIFQTDIDKAAIEPSFAELRQEIIHQASLLPHVEREYLASFAELRDKIESLADAEQHYLRWLDYLTLMPDLSTDLMRDYANALTFLGVCQYFPSDVMLADYVFLRPKWIIDALFSLLLHPSLEESRGLFTEIQTRDIWQGQEYEGMHSLLVRMMEEFELCYRVEGSSHAFIVPQRLPEEKHSYGWDNRSDRPVQYKYKFLPKGILIRLICRLHKRIEHAATGDQRVWSDAVIFSLPDGKGRVLAREVYSEDTIELRAVGLKANEMLNEVIRCLDDINQDTKFENLHVSKGIPCPCAECAYSSVSERQFFDYMALQNRLEKGGSFMICKTGNEVTIEDIFGKSGVDKPALSFQARVRRVFSPREIEESIQKKSRPLKVFFSYSKKDKTFLDEFIAHLSALRRQKLIEPWDDSKIIAGEDWDDSIKTALREADIIFLLLSHNFLNADYIWEEEIAEAMRRHETGQVRVVPIKIRPCDWAGLSFSKLQGLPRKNAVIEGSVNPNAVWAEIVEDIKAVIKAVK